MCLTYVPEHAAALFDSTLTRWCQRCKATDLPLCAPLSQSTPLASGTAILTRWCQSCKAIDLPMFALLSQNTRSVSGIACDSMLTS